MENEALVNTIRDYFKNDFFTGGYIVVAQQLKNDGWTVNKKKVYRIMKENALLKRPISTDRSDKNFVLYRVAKAERPYEQMQIDISNISMSIKI